MKKLDGVDGVKKQTEWTDGVKNNGRGGRGEKKACKLNEDHFGHYFHEVSTINL